MLCRHSLKKKPRGEVTRSFEILLGWPEKGRKDGNIKKAEVEEERMACPPATDKYAQFLLRLRYAKNFLRLRAKASSSSLESGGSVGCALTLRNRQIDGRSHLCFGILDLRFRGLDLGLRTYLLPPPGSSETRTRQLGHS